MILKLFLLSITVLGFLGCSRPGVWIIHDLAKINPQTAQAYEADSLYTTALPDGYKDKNTIWDAGKRTILLQGLRDEVLAFQVIVESKKPLTVEDVEVTDLKGPGVIAAKRNVTVFNEWFLQVKEPSFNKMHWIFSFGKGWYPSALIPVHAKDVKDQFTFPIHLPSRTNKIDNQQCLAFWIDLYIPEETKAGSYTGQLKIRVNGKPLTYKVNLKVGNTRIPPVNHSNFMVISVQMRNLYNFAPQRVREVNFLFHKHRVEFLPYKYYMETQGKGKHLNIFWDRHIRGEQAHLGSTHFIRDVLPYLRDSTYTERHGYYGPARNHAPQWVASPLAVGWFTRKGIKYNTPEYDASFLRACDLVEKKYKELGIQQKKMAFILKADEPDDMETLQLGLHHADLFYKAKKKFGFEYYYRMDGVSISSWGVKRYKKDWTPDSVFQAFGDKIHIWSQVAHCWAFPTGEYNLEYFRKRYGGEYWLCHTNTTGEPGIGANPIDCESVGILTWPWILWKYPVDGGMFWEAFFMGTPEEAEQYWMDPLVLETARKPDLAFINGEGSCLYQGEHVLNSDRPLPGIRLKLIRRAQQDYEYFYLLSQQDGNTKRADSLVASVLHKALWDAIPPETKDWQKHKKGEIDPEYNYMKGKWSHDPEDWVRARYGMFEMIEDCRFRTRDGH